MVTRALLFVPCAACLVEPGPPACRPTGPLPNASTSDVDSDPWLSEDRLELVFASHFSRSSYDLFRATRTSPDLPFDPPAAIEELSTTGIESGPFITDNGVTIWFARGVDDTHLALFTASRTARAQPFGAATEVTALGFGGHPSLTSDGLTMYFERADSQVFNIYTATRSSTTAVDFSTPQRVDSLVAHTGLFSVGDPSISGDGSLIYYDTQEVNMQNARIVRAPSIGDGAFGMYEPVSSIDTNNINLAISPRLLRDGKTVVYSARTSTKEQDIYVDCE